MKTDTEIAGVKILTDCSSFKDQIIRLYVVLNSVNLLLFYTDGTPPSSCLAQPLRTIKVTWEILPRYFLHKVRMYHRRFSTDPYALTRSKVAMCGLPLSLVFIVFEEFPPASLAFLCSRSRCRYPLSVFVNPILFGARNSTNKDSFLF